MMQSLPQEYITESIKSFRGMKSNAEQAIHQLANEDFHFKPNEESNSIAIIMKHLAGNMISRFTGFLTSDGEKPDRNRDGEFEDDFASRETIMNYWNKGWGCVFKSLEELKEEDLLQTVYIRNEPHTVLRAIQRQLVHYAYHCGQLVFLAKQIKSADFKTLSIARGKSNEFIIKPPQPDSGI
jgi:hypothetical protein